MLKNLEELILLIRDRKKFSKENSYTEKLLKDNSLATKKIREEIEELIESVENNSNKCIRVSPTSVYNCVKMVLYFDS